MNAPTLASKIQFFDRQSLLADFIPDLSHLLDKQDSNPLEKAIFEECLWGILVFTEKPQLVYANSSALQVLSQLQPEKSSSNPIPHEIRHICQSLIQSRHLFPSQNWMIEFDIFTNAATTLHICSRWVNVNTLGHSCLLLTIEDRQKAITDLVLDEAERYGLTPREKEVWLLQHNNYTYKQIAAELGITPNTVKKHVRSIYAKKKAQPSHGDSYSGE
ncbi:MAG: helix-turn-helix transcriptional regulator [Leptolyngbyaceae cyanobacterium SM2_5_2]|nr:helix-turn-helix transcriptional regulator [Leptolyngbyaceae cyanobacterium SM2_5_2]